MSKLKELQLCAALITIVAAAALFRAAGRAVKTEIIPEKSQVTVRRVNTFSLFCRFSKLLFQLEYTGTGRTGRKINAVKPQKRNKKRMKIIVMAAEMKGTAFAADRTDCPGNLTGRYYFGI